MAVAIICKTPSPGKSKTRLSPPLRPDECAAISACFIADLAATIVTLEPDGDVDGYAVYTPLGSEIELRALLPSSFELVLQHEGDFGHRLKNGIGDLLALGHSGAILINSDSPTLPRSILRAAVDAVVGGDTLVLSPATDGGYTLIGLSVQHAELFRDIPWSTSTVFELSLQRAREIGLSVTLVDAWYDVDDADSYAMLEDELDGVRPPCGAEGLPLEPAARTREFVSSRRNASTSA